MLLLLSIFICVPAIAQDGGSASTIPQQPRFSLKHDAAEIARRFPGDQMAIFTAPVHATKTPRVLRFIAPFAVGAALITVDKRLSSQLPKGHGGVSATIANVGLDGTAAGVGALYLYGLLGHHERPHEAGLLAAESLADSVIPHAALSMLFGRRRPYQGAGDELGEGDFFARHSLSASFPSGHSMFTWAMVTSLAQDYPSVPSRIMLYTIGTTVTVSRVTGREHFASDVVVGGAIGYLIARHVIHAHWRAHAK